LVNPSRVVTLTETLKASLGPSSKFFVLTGEHEASLELHAARYVAGVQSVPITPTMGLLSGGGMTCQIAHSHPSEFQSLPMELKVANNWSLDGGHAVGCDKFTSKCAEVVEQTGLVGKLQGLFVAIETIGGLLVSAGVGRKVLPVGVVIAAVEKHQENIRFEMDGTPIDAVAKWDWKDVVQMNYCIEALALLSLLHPTSEVFACRSFIPSEGAIRLSGGWALGLYHQLVQEELVSRGKNVVDFEGFDMVKVVGENVEEALSQAEEIEEVFGCEDFQKEASQ